MENTQDFEEQEQAQLWSLLSDSQKWLLCLMVFYPSSHWSELHPYIKKGEDHLRQLQEDWEGLLAYGACTQLLEDSPMGAIAPLWSSLCDEGFRLWLASEIARVQFRKKKDLWLPGAADLVGEQLPLLSPKQRDLLQQALVRQIDRVSLSGLESLHLSFYRNIWKNLLIQWEMYAEMVDLCEIFLTRLPDDMDEEELWECAYHATSLSSSEYRTIAMKRYKDYLQYGEVHAAYHNLSLLYKREHQYQEALEMIGHALRLEPLDTDSLNLKSSIEQAIIDVEHRKIQKEFELQQQKEQREQYLQGLEQKIQAHLGEVDYFKQKILQALKDSHYYSKQSFAKYLRMEDWAFEGHWKKLVSWGMILEDGKRSVSLHPLVEGYLE